MMLSDVTSACAVPGLLYAHAHCRHCYGLFEREQMPVHLLLCSCMVGVIQC